MVLKRSTGQGTPMQRCPVPRAATSRVMALSIYLASAIRAVSCAAMRLGANK
jgi:hypothetical protein